MQIPDYAGDRTQMGGVVVPVDHRPRLPERHMAEGGVVEYAQPPGSGRGVQQAQEQGVQQPGVGNDQSGLAVAEPGDQIPDRLPRPVGHLPGGLAGPPDLGLRVAVDALQLFGVALQHHLAGQAFPLADVALPPERVPAGLEAGRPGGVGAALQIGGFDRRPLPPGQPGAGLLRLAAALGGEGAASGALPYVLGVGLGQAVAHQNQMLHRGRPSAGRRPPLMRSPHRAGTAASLLDKTAQLRGKRRRRSGRRWSSP